MADRELRVRILGDSASAEKALKNVENAAQRLDPAGKVANKSMGDLSSMLTSRLGPASGVAKQGLDKIGLSAIESGGLLQTALVGGAAAGATALVAFATKGVGAFAEATAQVRAFQRVSGASAEDASKLVAASKALGIETDGVSAAMFKLAKNVATKSDVLKADGIEIAKNRQGNTDLVGTLLSVSDAYKKTQDPAQKAKIVFDAFGKSGAQMIPILARGRDGLKDLFAEAQKHHEIFTNEDLEKGRQFTMATRELGLAWKGLQIEAGKELVPELTRGAKVLDDLIGAVDKVSIKGKDADHSFSLWTGTIGNFEKLWHLSFGGGGKPKEVQAVEKATQDEDVALKILNSSLQDSAALTLQHMVATGRLTQAQLDQNLAMHHTKDGTVDYAAALKDLDPTTAKQIELQARLDAGLGDLRSGFQRAADAADIFKSALDQGLNTLLSANEATNRQVQAEDRLKEAMTRKTSTADEAHKKLLDIGNATTDLIRADEALIDAQQRDANGAITAADAKARLIAKLQEEQRTYPQLRGEIQTYIDRINSIPPDKLFTPHVQDQPARGQVEGFGSAVDQATRDRLTHLGVQVDPSGLTSVQRLTGALAGLLGYDGATVHVNAQASGTAGLLGDPRLVPPNAAGGYHRATPGGRIIRVAEAGSDEIVATKADPVGGARLFAQLYGPDVIPSFGAGGYIRAEGSRGASSSRAWPMLSAGDVEAAMRSAMVPVLDALERARHLYVNGRRVTDELARTAPASARTHQASRW